MCVVWLTVLGVKGQARAISAAIRSPALARPPQLYTCSSCISLPCTMPQASTVAEGCSSRSRLQHSRRRCAEVSSLRACATRPTTDDMGSAGKQSMSTTQPSGLLTVSRMLPGGGGPSGCNTAGSAAGSCCCPRCGTPLAAAAAVAASAAGDNCAGGGSTAAGAAAGAAGAGGGGAACPWGSDAMGEGATTEAGPAAA